MTRRKFRNIVICLFKRKFLLFSEEKAFVSPLLPLSPPPSECDFNYNLEDTEGVCDLFDIPVISTSANWLFIVRFRQNNKTHINK